MQFISRFDQVLRDVTGTVDPFVVVMRNAADTAWVYEPVYTRENVDELLAAKANEDHTHTLANVTDAGTAAAVDTGTSAGNVPVLGVGGLLPTSVLPSLSISEFLGSVASQAAMLALTGQRGDWAIRTDDGPSTWVLITDDPTQLANWKKISTPTDLVLSVNGQVGTIVLTAADLNTYDSDYLDANFTAVGHGHDISDVAGLQGALDGKAAAAHTHSALWTYGADAALESNFDLMYVVDDFTQARLTSFAVADIDPHGVYISHTRSSFVGGRLNRGLHDGTGNNDFAAFVPSEIGQYFFSWTWSGWSYGVNLNGSAGDAIKGSAQFGYQVGSIGSYGFVAGINNIAGAGCTVFGEACIAARSTESSETTTIVSHNNATRQIVLSGNKTTEYAVSGWLVMYQADGVNTPTTGKARITASTFDGVNTTLTLDRKMVGNFNATAAAGAWVMCITSPTLIHAYAGGKNVKVYGNRSFGYGEDIVVKGSNSFASGKTITNSGGQGCVQLGRTLNCGTGDDTIQIGNSLTQTTHAFVTQVGFGHTNTNHRTTALGHSALPSRYGELGINTGFANGHPGLFCLGTQTITHNSSSWFDLYLNDAAQGSGIGFTLTNNSCAVITVLVVGINTSGATKRIAWEMKYLIHRTGGTYTAMLIGITGNNADDPSYGARVAGGSYAAVQVRDADGAGGVMRWRAVLLNTEVIA